MPTDSALPGYFAAILCKRPLMPLISHSAHCKNTKQVNVSQDSLCSFLWRIYSMFLLTSSWDGMNI